MFGAVEAVGYANAFAIHDADSGLTLAWRLLTGPIVHACWAGLSGYFLGLASRYRDAGPWLALAGIGIALPAVLHGLNNWVAGENGPVWAAVQGLSAALLFGYARIGLIASHPTPATAPPARAGTPAGPDPRPPGHRFAPDLPTRRLPVVRRP